MSDRDINAYWRSWYQKHKERINAKRRDRWAKSKLVPECPRCKSRLLEQKAAGNGETYILCSDCRAYIRGVYANSVFRKHGRIVIRKEENILVTENCNTVMEHT